MLVRVVNIIFSLLFVTAAILQYNDPDPYIWIPIYLYAAVFCALAAGNRFYPRAYIIGIIIYSVYAAYLFFADEGVLEWIQLHQTENIAETMKATKPWIEQSREFFGLIILILALLLNYYFSRRHQKIIAV
jgi:hypothetical protein